MATEGVVVVVVLLIIIVLATAVGYYYYINYNCNWTKTKRHVISWEWESDALVKDDRLKDKLSELTEDGRELFSEFHRLEAEVRQTVRLTSVAAEINKAHNRYRDIGQSSHQICNAKC